MSTDSPSDFGPNSGSESALVLPLDQTVSPPDCEVMEEVRAGVDAIDRELVTLLTRRQGYMEAAARIKPALEDVVVPWRVDQVVQNAMAEAAQMGLSGRIVEPIWRLLVEKCIEHEHETWLSLRKSTPVKSEEKQGAAR